MMRVILQKVSIVAMLATNIGLLAIIESILSFVLFFVFATIFFAFDYTPSEILEVPIIGAIVIGVVMYGYATRLSLGAIIREQIEIIEDTIPYFFATKYIEPNTVTKDRENEDLFDAQSIRSALGSGVLRVGMQLLVGFGVCLAAAIAILVMSYITPGELFVDMGYPSYAVHLITITWMGVLYFTK